MSKTKKISLYFVAGILSALPATSLAIVYGGFDGGGAGSSISSIGLGIANAAWIVFTIIAVVAFVIAGIIFLTAFGETDKISKAKSAFIWGVVGVIVAILAFGITNLIKTAIGA
ncbi:MAG: hypothetical protein A2401_03000 [Candidatus Staskawiczbacteria bacterium RIFOXYC1_FULL_38_18]|uniref:Uncharacterized protein n=1 Tax=Candidatus Staskawiczbacteria bacterium RIFOXYC1_FULL_38_18 TaxID=1802229 RepID=A0A1G2JD60_9BACT|nr:MAG: hypothetical protein A2401_03000 [Candidatus Staskawiczbacteria bacterium RIFOXYC1_FULL_38_18]